MPTGSTFTTGGRKTPTLGRPVGGAAGHASAALAAQGARTNSSSGARSWGTGHGLLSRLSRGGEGGPGSPPSRLPTVAGKDAKKSPSSS